MVKMVKYMRCLYNCTIALMLLTIFLVSCGSVNEQNGGFEMDVNVNVNEKSVFEHNKQKVSEHITAENAEILDSTISRLVNAGVGAIKDIAVEAGAGGRVMLLTDDKDQAYYLELDQYGLIVILRKDGAEGEVLFAVSYD